MRLDHLDGFALQVSMVENGYVVHWYDVAMNRPRVHVAKTVGEVVGIASKLLVTQLPAEVGT